MQLSIVFLALLALVAAVPTTPKYHAADQDFLLKQQHVIWLLENIAGTLQNEDLYKMGHSYEFVKHYDMYEYPTVVKYYYGLYITGHIQPKGTAFSYSVSQLRKEVELLTQIFLGAKDYQTFLASAAWARIHVNQDQFVAAFSAAVMQRSDMYGIALPAPYEVYPHYFFNSNIIQMVHDYVNKYAFDYQQSNGEKHGVYNLYVNYTSYLPHGENKIAYFTEDIGLSAYYSYVMLSSYMMPYKNYGKYEQSGPSYAYGHGAHYYYIHQQLLARYNLERLSQGLEPIKELDYYYEHITTPYQPHFRYLNGQSFPGRDEHVYVTPRHHHYELVKMVRKLESRILDAIHSGYVITPEHSFLSLYKPDGLDILGNLIEGTGRSINPRYYGAFQYVARQLLGNAPEFHNIHEYTPSALELGQTAVRDPMFYQLYSKILEFFHYYQEALPSYQYNDVVFPGVSIEKVEFSDLVTYFSDYMVSLDNAIPQPVSGQHHQQQPYPHVNAYLKRLDHKQYEYYIYAHSEKPVQGAVVRVYIGPKYNYDGEPVDINEYRHWFYEIDQFAYDLVAGENKIVRNSHQATGQSYDYPSIHQLKERVSGALKSQNPYYYNYPENLYGFPARLTLPKGHKSGFPLQVFVIISNPAHTPSYYGPVVEQQWQTYQPQHYQVVSHDEYESFVKNPVQKPFHYYQSAEVIPDFAGTPIVEGHYHYGYLYNKYPVSYYYPNWQHGSYYGYYPHEYYHGKGPHAYVSGKNYETYYKQGSYEGHGPSYYYQQKYPVGHEGKYYEHYPSGVEGKHYEHYPSGVEGKHYEHYPSGFEGKHFEHHDTKYPAGYEGKHFEGKHYQAGFEGKHYPAGFEGKHYPAGFEGKHVEHHEGKYPAGYEGKHFEQHGVNYPAGYEGKHYEGKHFEGKHYEGEYQPQYHGSGHYPGYEGYHGTYPAGTYPTYKSHDEYLHKYYENQYIGDIVGGGVSLDNKPYGYPLERPLAYSAFYAHNIYVKDVYVYHEEDYHYNHHHY